MSGIQHYCFCRRQWALIHIEQQWHDNWRTVEGEIIHQRAHDEEIHESRSNKFVLRGLRVSSSVLRLSGICDVVEFYQRNDGISIPGHSGKWEIIPVEYKRGIERADKADHVQLCAESIALEEMFSAEIRFGFIYHDETRRREKVLMDTSLRKSVKEMADDMFQLFSEGRTPPSVVAAHCKSCSLVSDCLPRPMKKDSNMYIRNALRED